MERACQEDARLLDGCRVPLRRRRQAGRGGGAERRPVPPGQPRLLHGDPDPGLPVDRPPPPDDQGQQSQRHLRRHQEQQGALYPGLAVPLSAPDRLPFQLSEALPDISSSVGVLADDSRNIVELIASEYLKISEKIIMVDNANASDGLRLTYRSKCLE